jgi:hypothetical protein
MDPNANLAQQRDIAMRVQRLIDRFAESDGSLPADVAQTVADLAGELAELVQSLDGWRRHGGFSPYERTIVDHDVTFYPWQGSDAQVGYRMVHRDGRVEFLYLNPSADDRRGGPDGGPGNNVFLYQGTTGDPARDGSHHFYYVFDTRDSPRRDRSNMAVRS